MISYKIYGIFNEISIISSKININENEYKIDWNGLTFSNNNKYINLININYPISNN